MATEVEIWNMALGYLKAGTVTTTSDNSAQARALSTYAEFTRQEALRDLAPPFAQKVATLSESSDTNTTQYSYIYDLPSDYLRVIEVLDSDYYRYDAFYYVEGQHIFMNYSPGIIRYVYDNSDTTTWDADFVELFALLLAAKAAPKLIPGGLKYQQQYFAMAERKKIDCLGRWGEENFNHEYTPDEYNAWW